MAVVRWRWCGAAVVTATITLASAPAASAAWTSPFDIGRPGSPHYLGPVGAGGDVAVFTWSTCERLVHDSCTGETRALMRTRSIATGALGPVRALAAAGTNPGPVSLAVAADGDAVFAWSDAGGVRARLLTSGALGPILALTTERAWVYQPAIGPGGDALIAWMAGDIAVGKHTQARTLSAEGALGAVLDIPTPGQGTGLPGVGVGAGGDVVVAWDDQGCRCVADIGAGGEGHRRRLLARSASPASGRVGAIAEPWAAPRRGRVQRAIHPSVAVAGNGDALVSWVHSPYRGAGGDRPWARPLSASGVLGATITAGIGYGSAIASSGRGATVWRHGRSLRARTLSAAGRLGRVAVLGTTDAYGADPTYAVSAAGTAVVAWTSGDDVLTRSLSGRGRRGPVMRLARGRRARPRIGAFRYLSVAAGPADVVAWQPQERWMPQAAIDPAAWP